MYYCIFTLLAIVFNLFSYPFLKYFILMFFLKYFVNSCSYFLSFISIINI